MTATIIIRENRTKRCGHNKMEHFKCLNNTTLPTFHDHWSSTLEGLNLKLQHQLRQCVKEPEYRSKYTQLDLKPIVLITDCPANIFSLTTKSHYISAISYLTLKDNCQYRHLSDIMAFLGSRSVYVCITKDSLLNLEYIRFLQNLLTQNYKKYSFNVPRLRALLFDGLYSLPNGLSGYLPIKTEKKNMDALAQFLEEFDTERLKSCESIINKNKHSPRIKIIIRPKLDHLDSDLYLEKAYQSILDTFEDAGSYPRQYLLQLVHISNVQTLRSESNPKLYKACIEIQPNNITDCVYFLQLYNSDKFDSMLRDNIRVNSELFVGRLETDIDMYSIMQALHYYNPEVGNRDDSFLPNLISAKKYDELTTLEQKIPTAVAKRQSKPNSLVTICVTQLCRAFLNSDPAHCFEFLRFIKKTGCSDLLTEIRTSEGYNVLHLAVKCENYEFLKLIFYTNKWGALRNDIVKPTNPVHGTPHVGYTARRLAEALSFKESGYKILKCFDEYDKYYRSMPSIHMACLMGSLELVSAMVESVPSLLETEDENESNCLLYACASGSAKLVNYLLSKDVSRNKKNKSGETPIHIATMFGHLTILEVLYKHFVDIRGLTNDPGYTALDYGVKYGNIDVLKFYKDKGFKLNAKALTVAAKHRQKDAFDFILEEIPDVNEGSDEEGRLALHYSVINNNVSAVKRLLNLGADITLADRYNKNIFHLVAERGNEEITELLIDEAKRTDCFGELMKAKDIFIGKELITVIQGKDKGRRAWHLLELNRLTVRAFWNSMKSGKVDTAKYGRILMSGFGSDPNERTEILMRKREQELAYERKPDMTPLHVAAFNENNRVMEVFLRHDINGNVVDSVGATAIHYAAMTDNVNMMELLSKAGAILDVKTVDGKTLYQIADDNQSTSATYYLNGIKPMRLAKKFVERNLSEAISELSEEKIVKERSKGRDIRRYIIEMLGHRYNTISDITRGDSNGNDHYSNYDSQCNKQCNSNYDNQCNKQCNSNYDSQCNKQCNSNYDSQSNKQCNSNYDSESNKQCNGNYDSQCNKQCNSNYDSQCNKQCNSNYDSQCNKQCNSNYDNQCNKQCNSNYDSQCNKQCNSNYDNQCNKQCNGNYDSQCNKQCNSNYDSQCNKQCNGNYDCQCNKQCNSNYDSQCNNKCNSNSDS
ncbi:hypothetical protein LSH36_344g04026 [Paralvinella palmiformis]|uniref:Uncharacterized protein n=1 Tax=Paralvinella palmiformis TaxID=53620 RepID=A0AAD9JF04_9ANNE|nr:hypothetical protein LSH36_344g04026 [Paralvinella palmiformis]